jgi:hypothetical protein
MSIDPWRETRQAPRAATHTTMDMALGAAPPPGLLFGSTGAAASESTIYAAKMDFTQAADIRDLSPRTVVYLMAGLQRAGLASTGHVTGRTSARVPSAQARERRTRPSRYSTARCVKRCSHPAGRRMPVRRYLLNQ